MSRIEESLREAESYIEAAETQYEMARESGTWNPVIVNCIMAMIKSVDALMLEHRGETVQDHSRTSRALTKLYEDGLISDSFKSNVDSVRKWVVNEKTAIQYPNKTVSKADADRAVKAAERLLKKTKNELDRS